MPIGRERVMLSRMSDGTVLSVYREPFQRASSAWRCPRCGHSEVPETDERVTAKRGCEERETQVLTRRQRQIAALLIGGQTNAQIAHRLTICESTAVKHIENIKDRLEVRSRTQIAVWAVQHGLGLS